MYTVPESFCLFKEKLMKVFSVACLGHKRAVPYASINLSALMGAIEGIYVLLANLHLIDTYCY